VSSHLYPSDNTCTDPSRPHSHELNCFVNAVLNASETVRAARLAIGASPVPFYLTEFREGLHGGPGTGHAGNHSDGACVDSSTRQPAPFDLCVPEPP
jgi:hypothetical protein